MPSYDASLSNNEIKLLVDYLYEKQSMAGVVKPDPPATLESIHYTIKTDVWVDQLDIPWAITFLNRDTALVTERPGTLRVVVKGKLIEKAVAGHSGSTARGAGRINGCEHRYGLSREWLDLSVIQSRHRSSRGGNHGSGHDPHREGADQEHAVGG